MKRSDEELKAEFIARHGVTRLPPGPPPDDRLKEIREYTARMNGRSKAGNRGRHKNDLNNFTHHPEREST